MDKMLALIGTMQQDFYSTPTLENQPILTTRTDFVIKHPSVLQNTS